MPIWCTISGFGLERDRPGYDFVTQAECGWMSITGEPDGDPMKVGVALADVIAGKDATIAILGAVITKLRSGIGRRIVIHAGAQLRIESVSPARSAGPLSITLFAARGGE